LTQLKLEQNNRKLSGEKEEDDSEKVWLILYTYISQPSFGTNNVALLYTTTKENSASKTVIPFHTFCLLIRNNLNKFCFSNWKGGKNKNFLFSIITSFSVIWWILGRSVIVNFCLWNTISEKAKFLSAKKFFSEEPSGEELSVTLFIVDSIHGADQNWSTQF
jgi:hypothetical protein